MSANHNSEDHSTVDHCADFGPVQKRALLWFMCAIIAGGLLTYKLCSIDGNMYETGGDTLDYVAYRENRVGSRSIGSEQIDPRMHSSYTTAVENAK